MLAFKGNSGRVDTSLYRADRVWDAAGRRAISSSGAGEPADHVPDARSAGIPGNSPGKAAPFLQIPPFPGSKRIPFARPVSSGRSKPSDGDLDILVDLIRSHRVGGTYWGSRPPLHEQGYTLVRVRDRDQRTALIHRAAAERPLLCWFDSPDEMHHLARGISGIAGQCDPWHLVGSASAVIVDSDDELALIAAVAGVPVRCVGSGPFQSLGTNRHRAALRRAVSDHIVGGFEYFDPYSGEPLHPGGAIRACGFWRSLIDSNRDIGGAVGFAFWKRSTVAPLLWRGIDGAPFLPNPEAVKDGDRIAIWRTRTPPSVISNLERRGARLIEVEDGFIRSAGLGADCVPPLSIVVDRTGAHFDPGRPSDLEQLIQEAVIGKDLRDRARQLRELIVASGLSKYAAGRGSLERRASLRQHILVPGQVEDDRAVTLGGLGLTSNFELLKRVRAEAPDAYLIYKPHPDVEAGHRKGAIADDQCLSVADEIVRNEPIVALLELVDEVHVNTSLAGFEALLRGKPVTTHGVPFYAGWGLTRDCGLVPSRRTAKRTLDELVAAVLLLYPRYLDPVTGLPCPAEILVRRLADSTAARNGGFIVRLRRLQGRCRRGLTAVRQWGRIG